MSNPPDPNALTRTGDQALNDANEVLEGESVGLRALAAVMLRRGLITRSELATEVFVVSGLRTD